MRAVKNYLQVRLCHVDVTRGGRRVLHDIDWDLRPGERWVLVGANGAGKTQLLKLLAGSVWPEPSRRALRRYRWGAEERLTPFEAQDEIAYVGPERQDRYERYGWNHTVEQVVGTGLYRTDIPLDPLTAADLGRIAALLARLGVAQLAGRPFLTLSFGERRLVLLARALAARPRLLLMDELLNGLDAAHHARALRFLEATSRTRLPWVLSVHRGQDVPASATRALILEEGRVRYRGSLARAPLARWFQRALASGRRRSAGMWMPATPRRRRARVLVSLVHATVWLGERPVLRDISMSVCAGECWVVHGPNGSGKSTLIRTLYGDHGVAVGGRVERAGIRPGVPLELFKRRAGLVAPHLQADHPGELTAAEAVQSGLHASIGLNVPASLAEHRAAHAALRFFGIGGFGPRCLNELSYGQLRRVLFARAWVNRPDLLLLDEPYSGTDAATRHALMLHIEQLLAGGTAVVIATHNPEEWPRGATHELQLRAGAAVFGGPVRAQAAGRGLNRGADRGADEATEGGVRGPRRAGSRRR